MSNPILATTYSKLDTRVKEPSGVVPPTSGVGPGSPDRFTIYENKIYIFFLLYKTYI